jgi:hypothetical protein
VDFTVCAAMVNGKLHIDANEDQEAVVHIPVPVETIRDVVNRLEEVSRTWLRARNFRTSWLSLPASEDISDFVFPCAQNDFARPQRSFFLVCLANRYLPP